MEAGDVNRLDDFKDAEAQQKMVVGFINDVTSLVRVHPLVGIGIDHAIDAATSGLGPSEEELVRDNNRAHALIENGLAAAIVQGYADNGHIDLSRAEDARPRRGRPPDRLQLARRHSSRDGSRNGWATTPR